MSPASTIAPARPTSPTDPTASPGIVEPQHMQALARANEVRLARARMKREIGSGSRRAVDVVADCPWEAESMTLIELLSSQRRWGRARSRKLILSVGLTENKRLETLTQRQRDLLAQALASRATA
jgi:hypothetical protein